MIRTLLASLALCVACQAEIPDATYVCAETSECPPAFTCDTSRGLCVREAPCPALTCDDLRAECGSADDRCGGTLDCGTCEGVDTCGGGGVELLCGCTPATCAGGGVACGILADGCGGTLDCGGCMPPEVCAEGSCGCVDATVCDGRACGDAVDRCGGIVSCGTCAAGDSCQGGACLPGACVPIPNPCAELGRECGPVEDGCGGTFDCGSCGSHETCGGGGNPLECGCTSTVTCAGAGAECGSIPDGCGGSLECASECTENEMCQGSTCACRPDAYEPASSSAFHSFGALGERDDVDDATIHAAGSGDTYRWTFESEEIMESGISAILSGIPSGSDYDLEVVIDCGGAGGSIMGPGCDVGAPIPGGRGQGCASSTPGSTTESVVVHPDCNSFGTHTVEVRVVVRSWSGSCAPYSLAIRTK